MDLKQKYIETMKKRAKKSIPNHLILEVLQNGEVQDRYSRSIRHSGKIRIFHKGAQLNLPLFPFSRPIEVCEVREQSAIIQPDSNWSGFIYSDGTLIDLESANSRMREYRLKPGDKASLKFLGLDVLIKIATPAKPKYNAVKTDRAYRGSLSRLFLPDKHDFTVLGMAAMAALVIFGGVIYGLLHRPDSRPRSLFDLKAEYVIPFINPGHIETLPEALQDKLNRRTPLKALAQHYGSLALLVSGLDTNGPFDRLKPLATERIIASHEDAQQRRTQLQLQQKQANHLSSQRAGASIVSVPAVIGESYPGRVKRTIDKLTLYHQSLEATLAARRKVVAEFREDIEYQFGNYRGVGGGGKGKSHDEIAKIGVFGLKTDEETMYLQAQSLANVAEKVRKKIREHRSPSIAPAHLQEPIGIPAVFGTLNYELPINFAALDAKLREIPAGDIGGGTQPGKVREPLIGEIDPHLIEELVQSRKFELQLCFELALRRNQNLAGSMMFQWRLDSRGTLSDLELLSSSIADRPMISCVKNKIASWRFPRPKRGSVQIKYPLVFEKSRG